MIKLKANAEHTALSVHILAVGAPIKRVILLIQFQLLIIAWRQRPVFKKKGLLKSARWLQESSCFLGKRQMLSNRHTHVVRTAYYLSVALSSPTRFLLKMPSLSNLYFCCRKCTGTTIPPPSADGLRVVFFTIKPLNLIMQKYCRDFRVEGDRRCLTYNAFVK